MLEIIEYTTEYQADFKKLNLEWLEAYNILEEYDLEVMNNPQKKILDGGGHIYLAMEAGGVIGSAAIISEGEGIFELAKMAVAPLQRGRGISKLLIEKCLDKARQLQAKSVMLYSNSQLKAAVSLYEKYGFRHIDVADAPFATADVKMELIL